MTDFILNFGIPLAYIALAIAAVAAVAFPAIQMAQDLKKAKIALAGVGILLLVFILSYVMAGSEALTTNYETVEGSQMKLIEGSLYMVYILFTVSVIAILYASVSRYFK